MTTESQQPFRSVSRSLLGLLALGFGAVLVVGTGFTLKQRADVAAGQRISRNLEQTMSLNHELRRGLDRQVGLLERYRESPDPDLQRQFLELAYSLSDAQIRYLNLEIDEEERLAVESFRTLHAEMGLAAQRVFELLRIPDEPGAAEAFARVEAGRREIDSAFDSLNSLQATKLHGVLADVPQPLLPAVIVALLSLVVVVLLGALMLLRRRVLGPLQRVLDAAGQVRQGLFDTRAPVDRNDELGQLAQGFNFMAESLGESYATLERKVDERTRELRRLQGQLVQSEKMSAVGQLVSGVAHELNNPLTAIMGFAELAQASLAASQPEAPELERLEIILRQADRCRKIVNSLLAFARQDSTALTPLRLGHVVQEAVRLREYELGTHGVDLQVLADTDDPLVLGDAFKIQQVVLILVNNAVDAIREVRGTGAIRVRVTTEAGRAVLTIRDDGPGITEPERIFDPFYTTKPVGKGTGLGLSVCYGIVREHGGEIRAANRDPGAEFTVRLPLAPTRGIDESERPRDAEDGAALMGTALVVDDEEALVNLQVSMLARLGVTASGALDGAEAIRFLERRDVELVISDIRMPGAVDGLALYDWVRRHRPELARRFLLTSGDLLDLDEKLRDRLPVACVRKPFSVEEYTAAVREALRQ